MNEVKILPLILHQKSFQFGAKSKGIMLVQSHILLNFTKIK